MRLKGSVAKTWVKHGGSKVGCILGALELSIEIDPSRGLDIWAQHVLNENQRV